MRRTWTLLAACSLLTASTVFAQYPSPVWHRHGITPQMALRAHYAETAQASLARQRANVLRAQGVYNVLTSQSLINRMEAQKRHIENRVSSVKAYFKMKDVNRQARYGTPSKGARRAALTSQRRAQRETKRDFGPDLSEFPGGEINWPSALKGPHFDQYRHVVEKFVAKRYAVGALTDSEKQRFHQVVDAMVRTLKNRVRACSSQEYVDAKLLLNQLVG